MENYAALAYLLSLKKHHKISTKDLQKVSQFAQGLKNQRGERGEYRKNSSQWRIISQLHTRATFAWFLDWSAAAAAAAEKEEEEVVSGGEAIHQDQP